MVLEFRRRFVPGASGPSEDNSYSRVYEASGDYTVTLFVIDQDGGLSSTRTAISLIDPI